MKITFLGTGSIIPRPSKGRYNRSYSSILVEIGNEKLLFDIGPGTLQKMQSIGLNTQKYPEYLFITHYHIDHCSDYVPLVKSRHFDEETCHVGKGEILNVFGPPGLKRLNSDIFRNVLQWNYMSKDLDYRDVTRCKESKNGTVIVTKNWKVSCCPVDHYNGIAFRLDSGGKSFVYSGDMTYDERICKLGKNADLVALECSFPDEKTLKGKHLEPNMIANLAKIGKFKTIILTHMYPIMNGKEKKVAEFIKNKSGCNVLISYDFKKIIL